MKEHLEWMRRAIALSAAAAQRSDGGPIAALIVRDQAVLGQGASSVLLSLDPTAHAEIVAIRAACAAVRDYRLTGAVLYTTCEPCPMCLGACYWAGLTAVFHGCNRNDAAAVGFRDRHLYEEVALPAHERALPVTEVLREEASEVLFRWGKERGAWYSGIERLGATLRR